MSQLWKPFFLFFSLAPLFPFFIGINRVSTAMMVSSPKIILIHINILTHTSIFQSLLSQLLITETSSLLLVFSALGKSFLFFFVTCSNVGAGIVKILLSRRSSSRNVWVINFLLSSPHLFPFPSTFAEIRVLLIVMWIYKIRPLKFTYNHLRLNGIPRILFFVFLQGERTSALELFSFAQFAIARLWIALDALCEIWGIALVAIRSCTGRTPSFSCIDFFFFEAHFGCRPESKDAKLLPCLSHPVRCLWRGWKDQIQAPIE